MYSSSYPRRNSNPSPFRSAESQEDEDYVSRPQTIRDFPSQSEYNSVTGSPPSPPTLLGKKNARSFFHSSYSHYDPDKPWPQYSSSGVRQQTAELASLALSEAASSIRSENSPRIPTSVHSTTGFDSGLLEGNSSRVSTRRNQTPITELSEPPSPEEDPKITGTSYLTHLLRGSTPSIFPTKQPASTHEIQEHITADTSTDVASEHDTLLPDSAGISVRTRGYDTISVVHGDVEAQENSKRIARTTISKVITWPKDKLFHKKTWNRREIWKKAVVEPVSYVPAVILGLLLNILDGLSYGMILFPLGQEIFSDLGPDGLSMFYVSCIISQLVYSCGGSIFKGGIGSEMIEVVPFFHKMAFTILKEVGEENPKAVIATTILSFALSSILTGIVFFALGYSKLGSLTCFFPRHILVGCIGGVGWFLVATGIEVSARLDGNLNYNFATLKQLFELQTLPLWIVPLVLAGILIVAQKFVKHPLVVPLYFMGIPAVFYIVISAVPGLELVRLRELGWVFDAPKAGVPFWHFYTLYDFKEVDWKALFSTVPAMFALTFFGILHVPINVPALGVSTGEDNVDVDRELIAHGISNALSGFAGSIQNYLVYTNSILFIRSGGDSRVAGVMLAIGTAGIMAMGPVVIGYIPVMVVGALIFLLGIELLREALLDTWGKLSKLEYFTICIIVVTMGAWDFVIGILIGIVLACVSFVVQMSRKSAIRATYSGVVARSTVRRHPIQQRFLREVGRQIHVCKLAGYMFFGTIASVERSIRGLLQEQNFHQQPIRFLIIDLLHVSGIDFSAAEAFTRMRRLLSARNVEMILCGVTPDSEVGRGLRAVGVWGDNDKVQVFEDLNAALESCENEFLTTLYSHKNAMVQAQRHNRGSKQLDVPKKKCSSGFAIDVTNCSPRRHLVHQAVEITLKDEETVQLSKWQNFKQPLPLILQIFQEMTDKNEDFWFKAIPFFQRMEYAEGTILFKRGDKSSGFYLLEEGMFRAEYDLDQGKFCESIVAGTTCGELPFFSETLRSATVLAEKDTVAWMLDQENWQLLQAKHPDIAYELLRISLKLTTERMAAITSYVLTSAG